MRPPNLNEYGNFMLNNLIKTVINEGNDHNFYQSYKALEELDKIKFEQIILQNKLSSLFLKLAYQDNFLSKLNKSFHKRLKTQSRRFQAHSLQIIKEVHQLNKLFVKEGLSPLYLKGVAIQKEYKEIAIRPMADIDILFKKEEILLAYKILHENNFLNDKEEKFLNKNNINDFCSNYHHHIHVISKNNISIELHHRITPLRSFVECPISKAYFDGSRTIEYFGEKILVPSIENVIIHLLCHFSINSSFNKNLQTLVDIRAINNNYKINWEEIVLKYRNKKIRKSICLSLELINLNIQETIDIQNIEKNPLIQCWADRELIKELQTKIFDVSRKKSMETFIISSLKLKNRYKTILKILFPPQRTIIYRYKISKPTWSNFIKAYTAYYLEHVPKLFELIETFLVARKRKNYIRSSNLINNWFNNS